MEMCIIWIYMFDREIIDTKFYTIWNCIFVLSNDVNWLEVVTSVEDSGFPKSRSRIAGHQLISSHS